MSAQDGEVLGSMPALASSRRCCTVDDCLAITFLALPANATTWAETLTGSSDTFAVDTADLRAHTQPRDEKHAIDLTRVRELQHPSAMTIQADSSTMTTPRPPDPIAQRTIPSTMVPLCGFSSKVGPFAAMLNRPQSGPSRPRRRRPHPALRPATLRHSPRRAPGISTQ